MDNLYSVSEAAKRLGGISKWTIYRWVSIGKLAYVKIGTRTMICESELLRVIEEGAQARMI
jgi:excisionase family DNA binding protein